MAINSTPLCPLHRIKFLFDPRNDSDSLHHQCGGVLMKGVICLQLCEVAHDRCQGQDRQYVNGLKRVLEAYVPVAARRQVQEIKARGIKLFAPELGGR